MIPDKEFTIEQVPAWGQSACAVPGSPTLTEGTSWMISALTPPTARCSPDCRLSLAIDVSQLTKCNPVPLTGAYRSRR